MAKKKQLLGIDEGFLAEIETLDVPRRKAKIAAIEAYKQETKDFLDTNETIVGVRDRLKELTGPSRDTIKACRNQQRHLIKLLREQGEFILPQSGTQLGFKTEVAALGLKAVAGALRDATEAMLEAKRQ